MPDENPGFVTTGQSQRWRASCRHCQTGQVNGAEECHLFRTPSRLDDSRRAEMDT